MCRVFKSILISVWNYIKHLYYEYILKLLLKIASVWSTVTNVQAAGYIQGQCWIYYIELPTFYKTTGMFLGKRKNMKSCAIINLWRNNFSVSFLWSKEHLFFIINLWLTWCAFTRKAFMKHQISCWFGISKHIDTSKNM